MPPINIFKLFSLPYLLNPQPVIATTTIWWLLGVALVALVAAVGLAILRIQKDIEHAERVLFSRYLHWCVWLAVILSVHVVFRYERVSLLSSRIILVVLLILMLVWLGYIIKYQVKVVPVAKKQREEQRLRAKYIPARKRKHVKR
ncbi:MAG: hypothetical protein KBB55_01535 [Candidatus Buchananbacteria bacterium]|nr:hypothetical protein [Candidatus Buchananbacteria bacterium]